MAETLKGRSLAAFGLPHLKIVDILPTNLPAIESNELRLDNLFVLDDGSVAIIDYESVFKKENFVKYLNYIARVIKRCAGNKQLDLLVSIKVIIIYTADVEWAEEIYDLGGLRLVIEPADLVNFDTNMVYQRLNEKIGRKERLSEEELMELMIPPLTVKGKEEKTKHTRWTGGAMITIFNRRELYVTFDMKKFNELRSGLEQAGIEYTYRTVSQSGSAGIAPNNRGRMGSIGTKLEKDLEYIVYVRKTDYEKALYLLK